MEELIAFGREVGPVAAVLFAIAVGFVLQSRSLNIVAASNSRHLEAISEIATTTTTELRERNDRIGTLEASLLAEREANHLKTLQIEELRGALKQESLTLGQREFELREAREANSALKAAKDELGTKFATLSASVGDITSRIEGLEAELSEAKEHSTTLEDRQNKMEAELAEAKALREQAEALSRQLTEERDRLLVENHAQAEMIEQYASRLTAFEEENRQLRERLTELEAKIERMNHVDEGSKMVGAGGGTAGAGDVSIGGDGAG